MIKVRLFSNKDYPLEGIDTDPVKSFEYKMANLMEDGVRPYRDGLSIAFLKETYGVSFIDENDWYRVRCDGHPCNISELNDELKGGLAVLENSRKGVYTEYQFHRRYPDPAPFKQVEDFFAGLGMDVLVAYNMDRYAPMSGYGDIYAPYVIENYPYGGGIVQVHVEHWESHREDEGYQPLDRIPGKKGRSGLQRHVESPTYNLSVKEGVYYSSGLLDYAFQYRWRYCLPEVIGALEKEFGRTVAFDGLSVEYESSAFMEKLSGHDSFYMTGVYDEEVGWKKGIKVVSHWKEMPMLITQFRKLPVCYLVQAWDGTWMAAQELTSKFPTVAELAEEAINLSGTAKRVSVLYVADDELIPSARELVEGIWFGADVKDGCVELFDRTGAGMRFLEVLKEAVASGNVRAVHMESNWRDEVSKG